MDRSTNFVPAVDIVKEEYHCTSSKDSNASLDKRTKNPQIALNTKPPRSKRKNNQVTKNEDEVFFTVSLVKDQELNEDGSISEVTREVVTIDEPSDSEEPGTTCNQDTDSNQDPSESNQDEDEYEEDPDEVILESAEPETIEVLSSEEEKEELEFEVTVDTSGNILLVADKPKDKIEENRAKLKRVLKKKMIQESHKRKKSETTHIAPPEILSNDAEVFFPETEIKQVPDPVPVAPLNSNSNYHNRIVVFGEEKFVISEVTTEDYETIETETDTVQNHPNEEYIGVDESDLEHQKPSAPKTSTSSTVTHKTKTVGFKCFKCLKMLLVFDFAVNFGGSFRNSYLCRDCKATTGFIKLEYDVLDIYTCKICNLGFNGMFLRKSHCETEIHKARLRAGPSRRNLE